MPWEASAVRLAPARIVHDARALPGGGAGRSTAVIVEVDGEA
jgi:hypothetical protein